MLVAREIICLVLFVGSVYGWGQQAVLIEEHIRNRQAISTGPHNMQAISTRPHNVQAISTGPHNAQAVSTGPHIMNVQAVPNVDPLWVQRPVHFIGRPNPNSSDNSVNKQSENTTDMGDIYQAPMRFPDWPFEENVKLGPRIYDDSYPMINTSEPIESLPDTFDTFKPKYDLLKGLGYYRIVKGQRLNWEEARAACRAEGAHLAVINSKREANALGRLFFNHGIKPDLAIHTTWIGAYRPQGQQHYITVHGTQLKEAGFNTWVDQGHLNSTSERCVVLHAKEAKLSSTLCGTAEHHMCEHPL